MNSIAIVRDVAKKYNCSVDELRAENQTKRVCAARREAMVALRDAGMSAMRIAILLHKHVSTVDYHIYPAKRAGYLRRYKQSRSRA